MKTEILTILKENDGFVSGQDLCSRLKVSRTAVWKVIGQLQEEGYQIEGVRNKGYRLLQTPDVMTAAEIGSRLHTRLIGKKLVYYDETDSTNIQGAKLAREGCPDGTVVVADSQTAGKGRRGRNWSSPHGSSIYISFVLRPDIPPACASSITLIAGMAAAEAIKAETGILAGIKWPNDVVINGKKVCGILTEMNAEVEAIHYIVSGIGINVNQQEFPEEIRETATSLKLEGKKEVNRSSLAAKLAESFERFYEIFLQTGDLSQLKDLYEGMLVNLGRQVKVLDPKGDYQGICRGINIEGELLVECPGGDLRQVRSGEVSVRGVYGYV
mgnify:FL=1